MGFLFTVPMGFLFTATLAFLFTMTLGFQLTISTPDDFGIWASRRFLGHGHPLQHKIPLRLPEIRLKRKLDTRGIPFRAYWARRD